MPRPTDTPDSGQTLPHPELNPLINPVLGNHMGRWAEVYFTNPPERRDQAVIELLRELEAESQPEFAEGSRRPASRIPQGNELVCAACGHEYRDGQRFCGICGEELHAPHVHAEPMRKLDALNIESRGINPLLENAQAQDYAWEDRREQNQDRPNQDRPKKDRQNRAANSESRRNLGVAAGTEVAHQDAWEPDFLHTSRSNHRSGEAPSLMLNYEPESYRYRVYLGVTLAILLSVFIYMAWRSTLAGRSAARPLPQAVPASTPEQTSPVAKSATAPKAESTHTNPQAAQAAPSSLKKQATPDPQPVAQPATTKATPSSASARPVTTRGNGSDELAIAQSYLQGTAGKARDESEAAKWLWKSLAKHNDAAALQLSDLYLRGNGVGKNCDQARLLLDAAARKGIAGAADRLRNLQAFGCQ